MILETGELDSGGELLGERPGDGWSLLRFGDELGRLTIRYGKGRESVVTYDLVSFPAVGGRGVRLAKRSAGTDPDDLSHDVILPDGEFPTVCSCRGHARWQRCKHGAAVRALAERGLLDVSPSDPIDVEVRPAAPPPAVPRRFDIPVPF